MATYGTFAWNADGSVKFDPTKQTIKFLGNATIGGSGSASSGTITDSRFTAYAGHKPFWARVEIASGSAVHDIATYSFSGNNLNWAFPAGSLKVAEKIIYGIIGTR